MTPESKLKGWRVSSCRGCGAGVIWAMTTNKRLQPFNSQPDPAGNRRFEDRGDRWRGMPVPTAIPVIPGEVPLFSDEPPAVYLAHHATCPHAQRWR